MKNIFIIEDDKRINYIDGVKNVEATYNSFTNREMYLDPRIKIEIDDNSYNKEFANYKESYDYSYINKVPELMITAYEQGHVIYKFR
ncbi:hypothetical protein [Clostridium chrysemydis]|uniref:hypothetical protein n=1 Tax=Clostridium chrysemydis TaxID=2665504 RepID=UPI00188469C6|nr:hypothetical protein [Clostridium chrysemydis]